MTSGIADRLAGQHVLITGVTGFVGEALLQRLLAEIDDLTVSLLVRPKKDASGEQRIRDLLAKPIFAEAVARAGGVDALVGGRVRVVEGDMAAVPPLPTDLDSVVHCAGDVSFNPPVDEAFQTNVIGTRDLIDRIDEVGAHLHYLHVSTAYVAGRRRGSIPETPVDHLVDHASETEWGLAQRAEVERESRSPDVLAKLTREAEREHGRAGLLTAAEGAEKARRRWVDDRLVDLGRNRARSLGWTDCYTFTKAMGERVVEQRAARALGPTTILRPSIIESALETPHAGWIEGFKMAEPLILAYGRGELPEFPGAGDTVIDIVPVDHVVAATMAALAYPPEPGDTAVFHVSSGARNPLTFTRLYELVREYFEHHPFVDARGSAKLPEWQFPGSATVERLLGGSERAHKAATWALDRVPRSDRTRTWSGQLHRTGRRLRFLRRYLDLYNEYLQADLRFVDDATMALYRGLSEVDQERFAFDTSVVDWKHYLQEVHCPAVTSPVRAMNEWNAATKKPRPAVVVLPPPTEPEHPGTVAAFFDLDGTLMSSNVIESFLWLRLQELSAGDRVGEIGRMASRLPSLIGAERKDRGAFLRAVYSDYEGADLAALDEIVDETLTDHVLSRLAPAAVRRVRAHRAAGHRTVLITGAIRPLTRPLAPLFDHIEAADLATDEDGICTGFLGASPLVGEARGAWMRAWSGGAGIDLSESHGYADSLSDLSLLTAVGHPVAVRPDVALQRHAKKHKWPIVDWASPETASRSLNPAGAGR